MGLGKSTFSRFPGLDPFPSQRFSRSQGFSPSRAVVGLFHPTGAPGVPPSDLPGSPPFPFGLPPLCPTLTSHLEQPKPPEREALHCLRLARRSAHTEQRDRARKKHAGFPGPGEAVKLDQERSARCFGPPRSRRLPGAGGFPTALGRAGTTRRRIAWIDRAYRGLPGPEGPHDKPEGRDRERRTAFSFLACRPFEATRQGNLARTSRGTFGYVEPEGRRVPKDQETNRRSSQDWHAASACTEGRSELQQPARTGLRSSRALPKEATEGPGPLKACLPFLRGRLYGRGG